MTIPVKTEVKTKVKTEVKTDKSSSDPFSAEASCSVAVGFGKTNDGNIPLRTPVLQWMREITLGQGCGIDPAIASGVSRASEKS